MPNIPYVRIVFLIHCLSFLINSVDDSLSADVMVIIVKLITYSLMTLLRKFKYRIVYLNIHKLGT